MFFNFGMRQILTEFPDFGSSLNVRVSSRVFHKLRVLGLIRESRVPQVWSRVSGRAGFYPKLIFLLGSGNYSFGSGFQFFGYPVYSFSQNLFGHPVAKQFSLFLMFTIVSLSVFQVYSLNTDCCASSRGAN